MGQLVATIPRRAACCDNHASSDHLIAGHRLPARLDRFDWKLIGEMDSR